MSETILGLRALNRATLERQLLLRRSPRQPADVLEQLVGLQAQAPDAPYVGLWTRLDRFHHEQLARLVSERQAVRLPLMRATLHLVSARDCIRLRPVVQPVLERGLWTGSPFGRNLVDLDTEAVLSAGRELVEERPRTKAELGPLLAQRWPERDPDSLANALTYLAPLLQVPPRGLWGDKGPVAWTTVESWLGRSVATDGAPDEMLVRYLAAFGPASVRDIQSWSGLTRLREVTDRLGPRLRKFRDEQGKELLDLPDAPRPDPETPAPPRFLPEYDNVQFAHADRSRIIPDGRRPPLFPGNGGRMGTFLVDGFVQGTWKITWKKADSPATLTIDPYEALPGQRTDALTEEGGRLLAFVAPDAATHDVRIAPPT